MVNQMPMAKLLCVYCASSDRVDPKYFSAATDLGHEIVARGWGLVYGGGKTGLMGAVARAVKAKGGRVVGVIPEFMKARELAYDEADDFDHPNLPEGHPLRHHVLYRKVAPASWPVQAGEAGPGAL